jgi:transposase-like protein
MKALKRRLDRVEEENAILKKAIGIFSTAPVEQRPR